VSIETQTVSFEAFIDKVCNKDFFSDDHFSPDEIFSNILGTFSFFIIIGEAHVTCHSPLTSKMTETVSYMLDPNSIFTQLTAEKNFPI
jgi:hypothetical protein